MRLLRAHISQGFSVVFVVIFGFHHRRRRLLPGSRSFAPKVLSCISLKYKVKSGLIGYHICNRRVCKGTQVSRTTKHVHTILRSVPETTVHLICKSWLFIYPSHSSFAALFPQIGFLLLVPLLLPFQKFPFLCLISIRGPGLLPYSLE